MGYNTSFDGYLDLDPQPTGVQVAQFNAFNEAWHDPNVYPSQYCKWRIGLEDAKFVLAWDGNEKFDGYVDWMQLIVEKAFKPWGIKLTGTIHWQGEDGDVGKLVGRGDRVEVVKGTKVTRYADGEEVES